MKQCLITIICFLLISQVVSGWDRVIVDEENEMPLVGVKLLVKSSEGDTLASTTSDISGNVYVPDTVAQKALEFEFLRQSYEPLNFNRDVPFPVRMRQNGVMLNELVVKATPALYSLQGNKLTYDVGKDSFVKDRSAYDALRNTPLIIAGIGGKITTVPGYASIEYRLNGLHDNMLSGQSLIPALESLPANQLKSIELTSKPSSDGDVLVVNIVTKNKIEGILGSISSNLSDYGFTNGLYFESRLKRFAIRFNYRNLWEWNHHSYNTNLEYRQDNPDLYYTVKNAVSKGYHVDMNQFTVGASFDVDDNSVITFHTEILQKTNPRVEYWGTGLFQNSQGVNALVYDYTGLRKMNDSEYNLIMSYERKYPRDGYLYIAYKLYDRPNKIYVQENYNLQIEDDINTEDYNGLLFNQINPNERKYLTNSVQAEWARWLSNSSKLSFTMGLRWLNDRMRGNQTIQDVVDNSSVRVIETDTKLNQGYGMFQASYLYSNEKFEIMPSLIFQDYYNRQMIYGANGNSYSSNRFYVNPNLQVWWLMSRRANISATYGMNRSVPTVWQLNPFKNYNEPSHVSYGNPDLKNENIHQLNLYLSLTKGQFFYRITSANRFSSNLILENKFLDGNILNVTYDNAAKKIENSVSFYALWHYRRFRISGFLAANYVNFKAYENIVGGNHGWYLNTNANMEVDLGKQWFASLSGQYNSTKIYFQGNGGKNFAYNISVSKSFFKNKLNVYLTASSFIPAWYTSHSDIRAEGYYSIIDSRTYHASWSVNLRWNFGHLKKGVKGASIRISDDDLKNF